MRPRGGRGFQDCAWRTVDFTRFSRARNPHATPLDLSLGSLVGAAPVA